MQKYVLLVKINSTGIYTERRKKYESTSNHRQDGQAAPLWVARMSHKWK